MDDAATPIGHRDAELRYYAVAAWEDPEQTESHISWARDFHGAMEPFSSAGIQVNFLTDADDDRLRASYGAEKYDRLVALKDEWDPENVFRLNANVKPSGFSRSPVAD